MGEGGGGQGEGGELGYKLVCSSETEHIKLKVSTARPRPPTMSSWSHSSSPGGDKVPTSATYESSWTQSSCLVGDNIDTNIGQL